MERYTVRVTMSETVKYHIDAASPQEAKELVLSGEYDPFETMDASIDDIEVN
uniref:Uncharacterized protein n=1 Tax=viral metagenome TaxID=1070528 RepID=A0A6M3LQK1_9ZZZZ